MCIVVAQLIVADRVSTADNAIAYVRLSVSPFPLLTFKPSDL